MDSKASTSLEDELRRLQEENIQLRAASESFGTLAERLCKQLQEAREAAERRSARIHSVR